MNSTRKQVNEKIIAAFKKEIIPWNNNLGVHINLLYKEKYNGVNPLLLMLSAMKHGFKSNWWGSASEIKSYGLHLKPNVKGTNIVVYKKSIFGTGLHEEAVYNLEQIEGNWSIPKRTPRYNDMERLIKTTNVRFEVVEEKVAYYHYPPKDYIQIPPKEMFLRGTGGTDGYYETIAHELMHWTEGKLGWVNDANKYSRAIRELRAEMGGAMLMTELGIPYSPTMLNFRMFVDDWIRDMREDPTWLFRAAVSACCAVDCLLALIDANIKRFNYIEERVA